MIAVSGGAGISDAMLISMTERIHEIGLRRVIRLRGGLIEGDKRIADVVRRDKNFVFLSCVILSDVKTDRPFQSFLAAFPAGKRCTRLFSSDAEKQGG